MEETSDPQLSGNVRQEQDFFRDTNVRLLGYASELGESFKNIIGQKWYKVSYAVAMSYVLADAVEKGWSYKHEHLSKVLHSVDQSSSPNSQKPPTDSKRISDGPFKTVDQQPSRAAAEKPSLGESEQADVERAEADTWPAVAATLDALLWHGAATVVIPGVSINRAVWLTTRIIDNLEKRRLAKVEAGKQKPVNPRVPAAFRRWVPAAVGLALIPVIVHPTDYYMDRLMDIAVRPYLGTPKHTE